MSYESFHCPKHPLCPACSPCPQCQAASGLFTLPRFCLFQNVLWLGSYITRPFRSGFCPLVTCIKVASMSFHGLKAHFFLALNNLPLSGCSAVCFATHLTHGTWNHSSRKHWATIRPRLALRGGMSVSVSSKSGPRTGGKSEAWE